LRIAIDGRELEGKPTGVGRYLAGLLRHWLDGPGEERFVVFHRHEPATELPAGPRLELRQLDRGLLPLSAYWEQVVLAGALARARPDVLFSPADSMPLLWNGPTLLAVHDLSYFAHPEWFDRLHGARRRWFLKRSVRRASRVLAVSEFTGGELVDRLRLAPDKLEVVLHGIDASHIGSARAPGAGGELRARLGLGRRPFSLMVGSIFERRFPLEVIGAFGMLDDLDLRLVIAGEDRRRHGGDLERQIEEMGLSERVVWVRRCSDETLAALYRSADHLIYLSSYEGFGLPPLEGMSFGLPAIVSGEGALLEVYGEAALTVDGNDRQNIAAAVRRLSEDRLLRQELVARGRQLAATLTLERCASRTLQALRDLGSSDRPADG